MTPQTQHVQSCPCYIPTTPFRMGLAKSGTGADIQTVESQDGRDFGRNDLN